MEDRLSLKVAFSVGLHLIFSDCDTVARFVKRVRPESPMLSPLLINTHEQLYWPGYTMSAVKGSREDK